MNKIFKNKDKKFIFNNLIKYLLLRSLNELIQMKFLLNKKLSNISKIYLKQIILLNNNMINYQTRSIIIKITQKILLNNNILVNYQIRSIVIKITH